LAFFSLSEYVEKGLRTISVFRGAFFLLSTRFQNNPPLLKTQKRTRKEARQKK